MSVYSTEQVMWELCRSADPNQELPALAERFALAPEERSMLERKDAVELVRNGVSMVMAFRYWVVTHPGQSPLEYVASLRVAGLMTMAPSGAAAGRAVG